MAEIKAEGSVFFAFQLLGKPKSLRTDEIYEVEGVPLRYEGALERRGIEAGDVMRLVVETAAGTTLVEFTKHFVTLGKEHLKRLWIDGEEVPIEEDDVLDVLRRAQGLDDEEDGG